MWRRRETQKCEALSSIRAATFAQIASITTNAPFAPVMARARSVPVWMLAHDHGIVHEADTADHRVDFWRKDHLSMLAESTICRAANGTVDKIDCGCKLLHNGF